LLKGSLWTAAVIGCMFAAFWWWIGQPMYSPGMVRSARSLRAPLEPPVQPPSGNVWQVESDIALKYFSAGSGRNVLIVHGGPGMPVHQPWPGLDNLRENYCFNYYDQRGCGGSTRPFDRFASSNTWANIQRLERTLGIGAHVADIERIRKIMREARLILIGHSWGGFLASLYAAEFPERVAALILIAPADVLLMPSPDGDLFEQIRRRLSPAEQPAFREWRARYLDLSNVFSKSEKELAQEQMELGRFYTAAGAALPLTDEGLTGGWTVRAQFFSLGRNHDYRSALKKIAAPVLVIHGDLDLQPEAACRRYVDSIPGSRLVRIRGSGHFPQIETPATFSEIVREFLTKV
jgi:proline iminopeptidase